MAPDTDTAPARWQRISTQAVRPRDRFEFCRAIAIGSHIERPLGARGDFFGDFRYATSAGGVGLADMDVDPCVSRFGPQGQDDIVDVGLLNAGTMQIRHGRDQTLLVSAGAGPLLLDPTRPMTTSTSRSDLTVLRLPRDAVAAAVGRQIVPRGEAVRPLATGALTGELVACLRVLHRAALGVTPVTGAALDTAAALALVVLAGARGAHHHWPGALQQALYRAARHALARQADNPEVTATAVAGLLGCSRAALYRLFAAHGQTVAGYLHEVRMQRATVLLRLHPQMTIGTIALQCSYIEPAAFTKAFRRRFGVTPRDWRARALQDQIHAATA